MPSSPVPLSKIPSLTQRYKLQPLASSPGKPHYPAKKRYNDIISLIQDDITNLEVSAIVNAANKSLLGGGGVDGAIHAAAGDDLYYECRTLGGCVTGDAKITDGYQLPCHWIIHTVGPIYGVELKKAPDRPAALLRACYQNSMKLAVENNCRSIAFPCISAGVYGYPLQQAAQLVLTFLREWLQEREDDDFDGIERIILCCFNKKDTIPYEQSIPLYFPPAPEPKTAGEDSKRTATRAKALPVPPSTKSVAEGEPTPKKQKTSDEKEKEEQEEEEEDEEEKEIEEPDDDAAEQADEDDSVPDDASESAGSTDGDENEEGTDGEEDEEEEEEEEEEEGIDGKEGEEPTDRTYEGKDSTQDSKVLKGK